MTKIRVYIQDEIVKNIGDISREEPNLTNNVNQNRSNLTGASSVSDNLGGAARKVRKSGDVDFESKGNIKRLKGLEKLDLILALHGQIPEQMQLLTISAQNLVNKSLKPIKSCLESHFNGDKVEFLKCFGETFAHSRFNEFCKAKDETCKCRKFRESE